jgi:periplasmic protein TonB
MEFGKKKDPKRRIIGLAAVVAIHVLFVYALINGLARKAIELLPAPIETKILEETTQEEEPPPPPPPPKLDVPPPPFIPPPEISIQTTAPRPNAITTQSAQPAAPKANKAPVVKAKNCREPDYPPVSERLGEAGTVVLQLLVGVDGKVTDAKVETSSGFDRLDKAALAALSRCKFTPGEVNGAPAPAWANLKYTFRKAR